MSRENWVEVAKSESLADGHAVEAVVKGLVLAVFRHAGELFAMDGMCAHQGGPLANGTVAQGCVTCPWHGWQYELATGIQTINRQPLQRVFPVRESNGVIEVLVE
jgi:nitrite reductase (NADH) small subunit